MSLPSESPRGRVQRIFGRAESLLTPPPGVPWNLSPSGSGTLPDLSYAGALERSRCATDILAELRGLGSEALDHDSAVTLRLVEHEAVRISKDSERYWLAIDALRNGYYGMFSWTPYQAGLLLRHVGDHAANLSLRTQEDAEKFLSQLNAIGALIDQLDDRTQGQIARSILMPEAALDQALALIPSLRRTLLQQLHRAHIGCTGGLGVEFEQRAADQIDCLIGTSFDRAESTLRSMAELGPSTEVGLSQYPGGAAVYDDLVHAHTTLHLSPLEIHRRGRARIADIRTAMAAIRKEVKFSGDDAAFVEHLDGNPRWRADSVQEITEFFTHYTDRFSAVHEEFFDTDTDAPFTVAPLPEALQAGMTFGYYDAPRSEAPGGQYLFNTANLAQTNLAMVGALTFHELVPGHHLQMSQQQAISLHPLHRQAFCNAFAEGWAEYAVSLANEANLLPLPEERFGRLIMQSFLMCRLVVDTGMNALGWNLEQARDYMRENSFVSEAEIRSETIRYSCDLPAQALAYALGEIELTRLRERTRNQLGGRFDIREFHREVLRFGAMPLPIVDWHIDTVFAQRTEVQA